MRHITISSTAIIVPHCMLGTLPSVSELEHLCFRALVNLFNIIYIKTINQLLQPFHVPLVQEMAATMNLIMICLIIRSALEK